MSGVVTIRSRTNDPNPQHTHNDGAPTSADGPDVTGVGEDDTSDPDLMHKVRRWWKTARDHWSDWRLETEESYAFVAGDQWKQDTADKLRDQGRPDVTFNYIGPFIDAICGLEISNRQEQRAIPRAIQDTGVSDLTSAAMKWARDECDAEDEESGSFRDLVICGLGVTQTRMDYDIDQDGAVDLGRVDPMEVFYDPNARKQNYSDARFVIRVKDVAIDAARAIAPGFTDEDLNATWANDAAGAARKIVDIPENAFYDENEGAGPERDVVRLVEVEWFTTETGYRVFDPVTRSIKTYTAEQHSTLQKRVLAVSKLDPTGQTPSKLKSAKTSMRKYHKAILGNEVLLEVDGPERGGFTYKAITGKLDRNKGTPYGLVRAMKDPQRWSNKFFAQLMFIIATNAKGGLMAEEGAIENPREAEDTWAASDAITYFADGALQNNRVQPKPMPEWPTSISNMMETAVAAIPKTAGFSPEMLGQVDRNQPSGLEYQRKQQGMVILSDFFNALRRYRKEQGRLLLYYIQTYISDGRLIRIGGAENAQYVHLMRNQTMGEYDIVVDDTPSSPNMKERTWALMQPLLPMLMKVLPPNALLAFLDQSPLPAAVVAEVKKQVQIAQQGQQQNPHAAAQLQELQSKATLHQAQAKKVMAEAQLMPNKMQLDMQKLAAQVEQMRAQAANSLQDAGLTADDQRYQQQMQAVDALLSAHSSGMAAQQQALDAQDQAHQQGLDAQQQGHDQAMDLLQHKLAMQQAAAGQANTQAAQQQSAAQFAASHDLAQQQAQAAQEQSGAGE